MPLYKASIKFEGTVDIEYEAMGDMEAGEVAADVFGDMDKGRLNIADIDVTDIMTSRMSAQEIQELKYADKI